MCDFYSFIVLVQLHCDIPRFIEIPVLLLLATVLCNQDLNHSMLKRCKSFTVAVLTAGLILHHCLWTIGSETSIQLIGSDPQRIAELRDYLLLSL